MLRKKATNLGAKLKVNRGNGIKNRTMKTQLNAAICKTSLRIGGSKANCAFEAAKLCNCSIYRTTDHQTIQRFSSLLTSMEHRFVWKVSKITLRCRGKMNFEVLRLSAISNSSLKHLELR